MLVKVSALFCYDAAIPKKSIRRYEPWSDFVYVDHRRFARSYRQWRKSDPCQYYVKNLERLAGYR